MHTPQLFCTQVSPSNILEPLTFTSSVPHPPHSLRVLLPMLLVRWRRFDPRIYSIQLAWDPTLPPLLTAFYVNKPASLIPLPFPLHLSNPIDPEQTLDIPPLADYADACIALLAQYRRTTSIAETLASKFNSLLQNLATSTPDLAQTLTPLTLQPSNTTTLQYTPTQYYATNAHHSSPLSTLTMTVHTNSIYIQITKNISVHIPCDTSTTPPTSEQLNEVLNAWLSCLGSTNSACLTFPL